jgi:hypothetical protein
MAEDPYRKSQTSLANLYAGKLVDVEVLGNAEKTILLNGKFIEIIQECDTFWIVLKDVNYHTRSGITWDTEEKHNAGLSKQTNKIRSECTCIDVKKVICIGFQCDPTKKK